MQHASSNKALSDKGWQILLMAIDDFFDDGENKTAADNMCQDQLNLSLLCLVCK